MSQQRTTGAPSLRARFANLRIDPWLLVIVGVMLAFGVVMVYSSSWDVSWRLFDDPNALFRRQLGNVAFGLMAMVIAAIIPMDWIRRSATWVIAVTVLLLITVLIIADPDAPRRAIFDGRVQPSELAKMAVILYLAVWMDSKGERLSNWGNGFVPLVFIVGIIAGLILLQPDLSAAITIGLVAMTMFMIAGARFSQTALIMLGSTLVGYLLVRLTATGRQRWSEFLAGLVDVKQTSYHVQHSLQAFFGGGILGRGLGASREKFGLLPAPHTDSIYAVIGEELGLIGAVFVLGLFLVFLWRGFQIAAASHSRLGALLASGITLWIGVEALVNMAVLLGLLPFAGNALPFFSYGGSNLVMTLSGVGLLLNVARTRPIKQAHGGEIASVGIRGRDRRRRVSRHVRRARARR